MNCGQPAAAAAGATQPQTAPPPTRADYRPQGFQPPPPSSDSRLPWPPPGGQSPPSLPPGSQFYGAPLPPEPPMPDIVQDSTSDTQRMLQPQGLFRPQGGQYGPPPGPGAYAPPPGPGPYGPPPGPPGPYGPSSGPGPYGPRDGQFGPGPDQYGGPPPWPGGGALSDTMPRGALGGPGGPGALGGPGGPLSRLPRSGRRLVPIVIAAVLVLVVVGAIMLSSHGNGGTGGTGTANAGSTPTATASATSNAAEKQAATALAALLPQSGTDRGDVVNAVVDVQRCTMLPMAVTTFNKAAKNRQTLLARLATLPGRSALPAALITDLTGAWQASAQVDTDLAKWASTAVAHCHKGNPKDPNLAATAGPNATASTDKAAFVKLWNPIAKRFGLRSYTAVQL